MKKDGLAELAQDIRGELKEDFSTDYDQAGAIGRRYRRQDEAGTPFCVTVDYESKEKGPVTLPFPGSMEQNPLPRVELAERLRREIREYKRIK
jgi:glycyl-tRNA synthetase